MQDLSVLSVLSLNHNLPEYLLASEGKVPSQPIQSGKRCQDFVVEGLRMKCRMTLSRDRGSGMPKGYMIMQLGN